ncbi:hypothetical protein [Caballeronia sp. LZ043]|uniref:hypothetical protein n=1 Tax=Caballeronia sp. LZ043 TaxID=3038569 RepID=UPI002858E7EB|nr:hypothetical protein [Caballeronia sp. LZ043]MDR5826024.1 hypothetical protein [Caballeronia sp. LZ043]
MTRSLEIKITISEIVTPALFKAMVAVSNPRQRAAFLKRVAEDALRGTIVSAPDSGYACLTGSAVTAATAATAAPHLTPMPQSSPERLSLETPQRVAKPASTNDDERPFDFTFLADQLGQFG